MKSIRVKVLTTGLVGSFHPHQVVSAGYGGSSMLEFDLAQARKVAVRLLVAMQ